MVKDDVATGALVRMDLPFQLYVNLGAYRLRSRSANVTAQKVIRDLQKIDVNG